MPSKGYRQTDEHKKRIAESHLGRFPSEETRQKLRAAKQRDNHPNWKGGIHKDSEGYIKVKMREHPRADKNGFVRKNILTWEQTHGTLPEGFVVHHINESREDDQIENLEAMPKGEHIRLHKQGKPFAFTTKKISNRRAQLRRSGNVMVTDKEKGVTACAVTP